MSSPARTGDLARAPRASIESLRSAMGQMFGAERRLRGRDHSRPGELSYSQLRSIAALGREREMTAGELAKSADLTPASVTVMVDQLEAANIVRRHRSTEDRRVCNISLTPEGWELLERKLAHWQAVWDERLSGFTDRELEAAVGIIAEVTEIYNAALTPGQPPSTSAQLSQ
jgi:DNA-binding MarR family transcriptional regulator